MKTIFALLLITFPLIQQLLACSCKFDEKTMIETYNDAEVIFAGKILQTENNRVRLIATFEVDIPFKNSNANDTILITTYAYGCGINFKQGEEWKIWAYKSGEKLFTNICTSSHKYITGKEPSYFDTLKSYRNFTGKNEWKYESNIVGAKGEMKDGLAEGEWTYFYPTGEIKSIGFYEKDKKEGSWKYYDKSEALMRYQADSLRRESEKTGIVGKEKSLKKLIAETPDLKKALLYKTVEYKIGSLHGQTCYYLKGKKTESVSYQNGMRHGEKLYFNKKGEVTHKVIFENGRAKP